MKNKGLVKTVIIILAVVSIALMVFYAVKQLGDDSPSTGALTQGDIANYGQEESLDSSSSLNNDSYFTPTSGGDILISDNGTVEMDSIPNTLPEAPAE